MISPVPLRQRRDGDEGLAGALLRGANVDLEWSAARRAATLRHIEKRTSREQHAARVSLLAAATCAIAALAVWSVRVPPAALSDARTTKDLFGPHSGERCADPVAFSPEWRLFKLAEIGSVEVSPETQFAFEGDGAEQRLRLTSGLLRAQIAHQDPTHPVMVVTPHLRVVVIGTRFDVTVGASSTRVEVLEGRVRVERGDASALVGAGQVIDSADARLQSMTPAPSPTQALAPAPTPLRAVRAYSAPTITECQAIDASPKRVRCLERVAAGTDLSAQSALHLLGLLARESDGGAAHALEYWRQYQKRFPSGALAPEVALDTFALLLRERRLTDAAQAAADFERRFGEDPRAPEVALTHAALLCAQSDRRAQGEKLLEELGRNADPGIRKMAMQARLRCAQGAPPWAMPWDRLAPAAPGAAPPSD